MELPDIRLLWSSDPRVTKQLELGQKYKEVSKYPAVVRDISFIVKDDFAPNNYFDLIRETVGEELIEEVQLARQLLKTLKNLAKARSATPIASFIARLSARSPTKRLINSTKSSSKQQSHNTAQRCAKGAKNSSKCYSGRMSFGALGVYISLFMALYFEVFCLSPSSRRSLSAKACPPCPLPHRLDVVPSFNEERTIAATIASLLTLEYPKDKLRDMVVDDGSRDNTRAIVEKICFAKISHR
jgi:hypothetical protein